MDHDDGADERLYELSRVLDSRARLAVLRILVTGEVPVAELVLRIGGSVVEDLAVLRAAGLVDIAPAGRVRLASLHVVALLSALGAVASVRRQPSAGQPSG
ncbi:hypothetical protein [Actinophytocola sp.]|jgi:DNA-binding transcriptional ArsR family regulator|uniref:hypothetical protein n=1 Tax=Actinophytocola sp. TaxID=1872138 RepID=UPI002ED8AC1F